MPKTTNREANLDCAVQLRMSKKLVAELEDIARRNNLPRSALIRLILSQYVIKQGDKPIRLTDGK